MTTINPKQLRVQGGSSEDAWAYEENQGILVYIGREGEDASHIILTWAYLRNALSRRTQRRHILSFMQQRQSGAEKPR